MTIEELVDSHGVTLAYFDNELWQRPGVYIKEISIIFINRELSENAKKRVIYHELGHLEILLHYIKITTLGARMRLIGT
ncbi:phage protein [Streptococcus pneumoniae]|nr:phage protein [Streptococcus pneumoniae]CEZ16749.1 phage protein [Streptococcus pneumoniae]CGE88647.1 phage protein [Streptococcus pneumoniae]CIQ19015.1 phage protein [Streptococcus pneumoniae]CIR14962.1 phage protein [Streptococcus pneumoniae]